MLAVLAVLSAALVVQCWRHPDVVWDSIQKALPRTARKARDLYPKPKVILSGPLEEPDYLGVPPIDFDAKFSTVEDPHYQRARTARSSIDALWKAKSTAVTWRSTIVPAPLKARTGRDVTEDYYQYRRRELTEYRRITKDEGAAKSAGEAFLEEYLKKASERDDAQDGDAVAKLGQQAIAAGSRDPMIRSYAALEQYLLDGQRAAAEQIWTAALDELRESSHPRIVSTFVRSFLHHVEPGRKRFPALAVALVRWLEEDRDRPEWRRAMYWRLAKVWDQADMQGQESLLVALMQSPQVDPWLVHLLAGEHFVNKAWQVRGGGFANTVTKEAWPEFERLLERANDHLEYSWLLNPEEPMAPAWLIVVAKAGHARIGRPYDWFLRSIEAQFDYWNAYRGLADSMSPRWGGSTLALAHFAQNCLDTDRFDTSVPYHVVEIASQIAERELEQDQSPADQVEFQRLLREFVSRRDRFRERHADTSLFGDTEYFRTRTGLLLERYGLHVEAGAEYASADNKLDFAMLHAEGRMGKHLAWRTMAAQGGIRDRVLAFDDRLRQPCSADMTIETIEELERELASLRASSQAAAHWYFESAARILVQMRAFVDGAWTPLSFGPWAPGWEIHADKWHWNDQDSENLTISMRSGQQDHFWARPMAHFQPPLEVQFDYETLDPAPYVKPYGLHWSAHSDWTHPHFLLRKNLALIAPTPMLQDGQNSGEEQLRLVMRDPYHSGTFASKTGTRHRFKIRLWQQQAEIQSGRHWVVRSFDTPLDQAGSLQWGSHEIAGSASERQRFAGALRLANVRIRKLSVAEPPAADAPPDVIEAYWRERVSHQDDDGIAILRLAQQLNDWERPEEVFPLLELLQQRSLTLDRIDLARGEAFFRLRRYREAAAILDAAVRDNVDSRLHQLLVELHAIGPEDLRDLSLAKSALEGADFVSNDSEPWKRAARAVMVATEGKFDEAKVWNQTAIEVAREPLKQRLLERQASYEAGKIYLLPAESDEKN